MYSSDYEFAIRSVHHILNRQADLEADLRKEDRAQGCEFAIALIEAAFPQIFLEEALAKKNDLARPCRSCQDGPFPPVLPDAQESEDE